MDLAEEALKGSQLAGARLIRLLEERDPVGIEGLKALYPHSGSAYLVGVTGPPGVRSTTRTRVPGRCTRLEYTNIPEQERSPLKEVMPPGSMAMEMRVRFLRPLRWFMRARSRPFAPRTNLIDQIGVRRET